MRQLPPPVIAYNSREAVVLIKALTWLCVLTWGEPDLIGAAVGLLERFG